MPAGRYPGHMAKGEGSVKDNLRYIDVVLEVCDARIPFSSRNPRLAKLIGQRSSHVLVLNKSDLADPEVTEEWLQHFRSGGLGAAAVEAREDRGIGSLKTLIGSIRREKVRDWARKGLRPRPLRLMVAGIPNVGKSSLLNRLAGRHRARTGGVPGITRGTQWIRVGKDFELLDLPGILPPRISSAQMRLKLAVTATIEEGSYDKTEAARWLLELLGEASGFLERYSLEGHSGDYLEEIGRQRGCLRAGGEVDLECAAQHLLTDFREGKLGRCSLEVPDDGASDDS